MSEVEDLAEVGHDMKIDVGGSRLWAYLLKWVFPLPLSSHRSHSSDTHNKNNKPT
jgi:hypothetical protein